MSDAIVVGVGEGEPIRLHRVLAELPELEAIELVFEPGWEGVDLHTHADHVDSFYVLEGEVEFLVGDETVRAGPGTYVAAPPNVAHGFRNPGPGRIRVLNVHAPNTGFIERLRRR